MYIYIYIMYNSTIIIRYPMLPCYLLHWSKWMSIYIFSYFCLKLRTNYKAKIKLGGLIRRASHLFKSNKASFFRVGLII